MGARTYFDSVSALARSAIAVVLSSALFSTVWGAAIAIGRGVPEGLLIDAFLVLVFVLPVVAILVSPIVSVLRRLAIWARGPAGAMSVFAVVLAGSFFVVAFLSRTTNADTGQPRYVFWAYDVGTTAQLTGVTLLIAIVGALSGALYWRTTKS
jgi:hypothetical protein